MRKLEKEYKNFTVEKMASEKRPAVLLKIIETSIIQTTINYVHDSEWAQDMIFDFVQNN